MEGGISKKYLLNEAIDCKFNFLNLKKINTKATLLHIVTPLMFYPSSFSSQPKPFKFYCQTRGNFEMDPRVGTDGGNASSDNNRIVGYLGKRKFSKSKKESSINCMHHEVKDCGCSNMNLFYFS